MGLEATRLSIFKYPLISITARRAIVFAFTLNLVEALNLIVC